MKLASSSFARLALCAATVSLANTAMAAGEVNLYTTREPALIQPLIDAFTKQHDGAIKVNT